MEDPAAFFHVPQQSRRHKLRFITTHPDDHHAVSFYHHHDNHPFLPPPHHNHHETIMASPPATSTLNLSLSSAHVRGGGGGGRGGGGGWAYSATPLGPFTGYASILSRSRFLCPAQELLEEFSLGSAGVERSSSQLLGDSSAVKNILEDSRSSFDDGDEDDVSSSTLRCTNPNLVSMLHEVYKRYKLYCQQMKSAVTSFESVSGLANAAPFTCFAVRAMFRHFHCLKNAILDQIRLTNRGSGGVDVRRGRTSGSFSEDKGPSEPNKQMFGPNFLQHPVWRSQRGFPDKAVAVLRTWLFEHFLHPYPSDSDKHMLAQKTGLSRSQVSNWFTNARVRLWKPMVEEMHALERKTQSAKGGADTSKFTNLSPDGNHSSPKSQLTEKDFEIMNCHRDQGSRCKRTRIESIPRVEQMKEHFGMPYNDLPGSRMINVGGNQMVGQLSHSPAMSSSHENASGLPWSNQGLIAPFWLARQ